MKKYLVILGWVLGCVLSAQSMADTLPEGLSGHYMSSSIIGNGLWGPQSTYILTPVELLVDRQINGHVYGNHVIFDAASGTFSSDYTARCGEGCFRSSRGTYAMDRDNRVRLHVTHISQSGGCSTNYDRDVDRNLGVFMIKTDETDGRLTLTAVKSTQW